MTKPTAAANADGLPDGSEILFAYRQWLHHEGRLLGDELFPELGKDAGRLIPETFAGSFHFPSGRDWRDVPKPSTRAAVVLAAVGVLLDGSSPPIDGTRPHLPAFSIGAGLQPAWALYEALRTLAAVANGLLNEPRYSRGYEYTAAGQYLDALHDAIAIAADQVADAVRSTNRPDDRETAEYRALVILQDAARSLEGLDEIADLTRDLRGR